MSERPYYVYVVDDKWEDLRFAWSLDNKNSVVTDEGELRFLFEADIKKAESACKFADYSEYGLVETDIDAVLLDVSFPPDEKAGFDLLSKLWAMDPSLPVIMMTEYPAIADAHSSGAKRARGYWEKGQINGNLKGFFKFVCDQISTAKNETLYDQEHKSVANKFASEYDQVEGGYPGSVAYLYFENEIIMDIVNQAVSCSGEASVSLADIGCGTGRIARLLTETDQFRVGKIRLTNVDFAGQMLNMMKGKLCMEESRSFQISRAVAERLPLEYNNSFDIVIMGFGFPSYTKYHETLMEAYRICRPGGDCLISVYNENSILYDRINKPGVTWDKLLLAGIPNRESGKLAIGGNRVINCETFNMDSIIKTLNRTGFYDVVDTWSFPVLYTACGKEELESFPDCSPEGEFDCQKFSHHLYELDKHISSQLKNKGHYLLLHVKKPK